MRILFTEDTPEGRALIAAACMRCQAEMLEWSSGRRRDLNHYDGTIRSLSRLYQIDGASPFQRMKHTTRDKDRHVLTLIETTRYSRGAAGNRGVLPSCA